ncbi:MAG: hypothetical protein K5905_13940 [Roseibium sp.]|uniref:hypothetical protein n=1 Tax=Roseibium sp. TaxID=1936156 RepID=UPI0026098129|nr:hypothetical protein [Roseibium sp.]MCV0426565.1 hypothetical protein [Roseibium sp.]
MTVRFPLKILLILLVFLSGCQSLGGNADMVHKTGSTVSQRQNVIDACQVAALEDVPPAFETRTVGGYGGFGPGYCSGWGATDIADIRCLRPS